MSIQIEGLARFKSQEYYLTCESSIFGDAGLLKLKDIYSSTPLTQLPSQTAAIYPNPTKGIVEIHEPLAQCIHVYDTQGRQIFSTTDCLLDLSLLEKGYYLIVFKNNKGQTIGTQKILLIP
jgi:hypothetical protein